MDIKIWKRFILDKIPVILSYYVGLATVILFFYLNHGGDVEVIYPVIIITLVLILYLMGAYYRYYRFHRELVRSITDEGIEGSYSMERQQVMRTIQDIHKGYIHRINDQRYTSEKDLRLLAEWLHNMKTPLSVMDMILNKGKEENNLSLHMVEEIEQEKDLLLNHLDQLLNLLRLEEFSRDFVSVECDLIASLRKVINQRKNQFIYHKVYPEIIADMDQAMVLTDKKWNESVIGQLVSNAIKYSSSEEESRRVIFRVSIAEDKIILTIEDQGIGIPKHDMPRIFEAFYTGDNGRDYRNSTGIGLYLVKSICDKLGHPIHIDSEVNRGTKVAIHYLAKM